MKTKTGVSKSLSRSNFDSHVETATGLKRALGGNMYEQLPLSKILRCDCIQSLRCGVMLAGHKKWKLVNNMSAELPENAAEKFGFLASSCSCPILLCSPFSFKKKAITNRTRRHRLQQLSIMRSA